MTPKQIFDLQTSTNQELLEAIGVSETELNSVVLQCYRAFASVSPLHPKGYSGTSGWADGTQAIRATLLPKSWKPTNPNGQPRVVSPGGRYAITVSSGDVNTGNPNQTPQTRNAKGAQTSKSVAFNSRQGDLFRSEASSTVELPSRDDEQMLWILLYYVDLAGEEVRYELSCPVAIGDNGKVDGWSARIIMPAIRLGTPDPFGAPDPEQNLDIPVIPKL
ncbi:hypothetical protein NLK61_11825 [Pseudomonas fuscovaginae UPB0736]|uniref:hypothetical protein n=1 Tax=Pseudomonas asplenii TaxID=53407 RepID=UPI0012FAB11E|nr:MULTISPECIES: hypothetical protein [Pseudomonas]UUQ67286.1 hypothetical protein NLK61_11825 [Pseudomonas fuscovaginae UPB0736]UZE29447.1 hypothetical protein LOY63_01465 [Pseudomonas asplenii]